VCTKFEAYARNPKLNLPNPSECIYFKDRSKFIELPCKVGDVVYIPQRGYISKHKVVSFRTLDDVTIIELQVISGFLVGSCFNREIGKTVFLTKEEAGQALRERNENRSD
jgi:hypothetical protein